MSALNKVHFPNLTGLRFIAAILVVFSHIEEQKNIFEDWVLTAEFHDYPRGWLQLFADAGYTGWYAWTVM